MTTDGGTVWDRGPSDDRPDPTAPSGDDTPTAEEPTADVSDATVGDSIDHASTADTARSDEDTVWSRGPSIDETLLAAHRPRPTAPEPVLPPPAPVAARPRAASHVRRPVAALVLVAVAAATVALGWLLGVVGEDDVAPAIAGVTTSSLLPVPTAPPSSIATAAPTPTTPTTTALSATSTTSSSTSTTSSSTSTTSTTSSSTSTTSTTSSSTSTTAPSSTTTAPDVVTAPTVQIVGRTGPCKFGSDCLIADFSIVNFTAPQREFVCEFGGGDRYTFRFDGVSAEAACATSTADGSITIEVGGVRSETVTR